jgi:hypothetical protein
MVQLGFDHRFARNVPLAIALLEGVLHIQEIVMMYNPLVGTDRTLDALERKFGLNFHRS